MNIVVLYTHTACLSTRGVAGRARGELACSGGEQQGRSEEPAGRAGEEKSKAGGKECGGGKESISGCRRNTTAHDAPGEVVLAALPNWAALRQADGDDGEGVIEGNPERGEEKRIEVEAWKGRIAQDEPNAADAGEEAAGIAEEDAGGRAIPPEEAEESACGGEAWGWGAVEGGGGKCGGGNAGALAVTIVEQVECV